MEPKSPTLQADSLPAEPQGKPWAARPSVIKLCDEFLEVPLMTFGRAFLLILVFKTFVGGKKKKTPQTVLDSECPVSGLLEIFVTSFS